MANDEFDDATVIMEALLDIRENTEIIIKLLEDENGEEEQEDS